MLESVIENHQIDLGMFSQELPPSSITVGVLTVWHPGKSFLQHGELVIVPIPRTIAATEDSRSAPMTKPVTSKGLDHRCLAGSS